MSRLHRGLVVSELDATRSLFDLAQTLPGQAYTCLLESTGSPGAIGRYSFFATNPFWHFTSKRGECLAGPPGQLEKLAGNPLEELRTLFRRYRVPADVPMGSPPFRGGAIGYFGYEMLYLLEDIPDGGADDQPVPDCQLLFFDSVIAHDLQAGRSFCFANGFAETAREADQLARERHDALIDRIARASSEPSPELEILRQREEHLAAHPQLTEAMLAEAQVTPVMSRERYLAVVEQAKGEIFAGNVFEVCTAHRFDTTFDGPTLDLYRSLRTVNQAPFAACLDFGEVEVVSSSPERFLELDRERWVETRPMKGTRPRGRTPEEDRRLVVDLATDEKSSAENMMIVDLARNDLGRVCQFGSVSVPQLRVVETYPFTHQLVSTVRGRLSEGADLVDLLRAAFPGGSMTGAPKVEAMKIIDRLEPVKRGIFSGSIGYIDFDGPMDLNIVIRTFVRRGPALSFHVGGAIVADSEPEDEYQETLDKAHGLVVALELARRRNWP